MKFSAVPYRDTYRIVASVSWYVSHRGFCIVMRIASWLLYRDAYRIVASVSWCVSHRGFCIVIRIASWLLYRDAYRIVASVSWCVPHRGFCIVIRIASWLLYRDAYRIVILLVIYSTSNNTVILWNITLLNYCFPFEYILKWNVFLWWQSWIFSIITLVFSVTLSYRNQSNMLICCSPIQHYLLSMLNASFFFNFI